MSGWLARTSPELARHKGISILILDTDAPGFSHTLIQTVGNFTGGHLLRQRGRARQPAWWASCMAAGSSSPPSSTTSAWAWVVVGQGVWPVWPGAAMGQGARWAGATARSTSPGCGARWPSATPAWRPCASSTSASPPTWKPVAWTWPWHPPPGLWLRGCAGDFALADGHRRRQRPGARGLQRSPADGRTGVRNRANTINTLAAAPTKSSVS